MSWGKAAILAVLFGTIVACTSTSFVDKRSSVSREVIEDNDRGNQYSDEGRYDEAIAAYTAAIKLNANFAPSFHNRAFAFYKLGKLDQAIADEDQALALDPNYPDAYLNRGNAYAKKNDHRRAIADFTEAIRVERTYPKPWFNRGNSYRILGNLQRALADYNEAIRLKPDYLEALLNRAVVFEQLGRLEEAVADYSTLLGYRPDYWDAYANRAAIYLKLGKLDQAIADFTTAINTPSGPSAGFVTRTELSTLYFGRCSALGKKGEPDKAIADCSKAIELDPNYVDMANVYLARGAAKMDAGDISGAIKDFDISIQRDRKDADAYFNRGYARYYSGNLDGAKADFDNTIRLRPDDAEALAWRCWILAGQNRQLDQALADCNRSLVLKKSEAGYHSRALAYLRKGRYRDAIADLNEALKTRPNQPEYLFLRGIAELRLGDRSSGEQDLAAARMGNPDIDKELSKFGITP